MRADLLFQRKDSLFSHNFYECYPGESSQDGSKSEEVQPSLYLFPDTMTRTTNEHVHTSAPFFPSKTESSYWMHEQAPPSTSWALLC